LLPWFEEFYHPALVGDGREARVPQGVAIFQTWVPLAQVSNTPKTWGTRTQPDPNEQPSSRWDAQPGRRAAWPQC